MKGRALCLLALVGCADKEEYDGAFAIPSAGDATVGETPFDEPVAYVASRASGLIQALATKQGRFLNDDPTAAYLRGNPLPTGQARTLSGIAAWTPDTSRITVFAADQTFSHLLEVPHVIGVDASGPVEAGVTVTNPVASGGGTLEDLVVRAGYATTETWTLTFTGDSWAVEGSRSGRQEYEAEVDEDYTSSLGGLSFTPRGPAEVGDTITFSTDSGLVEHVLGEDLAPLSLAMAPDQSALAVATWDDVVGAGGLHWWDPVNATLTDITLDAGARPGRMAWAGDTLYVADAATAGVWTVATGETTATLLPLPWPVSDVAPAPETGRLFVTPVSGRTVFMAELATGRILDINPAEPGVGGMDLFSPVIGIATLPTEVRFPSDDDDGVRRGGRVVAISLHRGAVVFMDQATGCLLGDAAGPSTVLGRTGNDFTTNTSLTYGPFLQENSSNGRHIIVNPCAGIARAEEWRVTYRAAEQAWEVRGALSGVQQRLAYADERYISDRGEISFLLLDGADPSTEGMSFSFVIREGIVSASGDENGDGDVLSTDAEVAFSMPGDPIPVSFRVGPEEGGWRTVDERSYAIVPLEGADAVSRVRPDTGMVDALWR